MDDRELTQMAGLVRVVAGAALFLAPRPSLRVWTGDPDPSAAARVGARGVGARDVAIGVGMLISLEQNGKARGWLEAAGVADAADAFSALSAPELPRLNRLAWFLIPAASAALHFRLAAATDQSDRPLGRDTL